MVAGIAPDQLESIALIQTSSFISSNKITLDRTFFLAINGINFFSTCFGKSKLTNKTLTFLDAYSLFNFSKAGNSFTQGAHQVAQKLITYILSFFFSNKGFNSL